MCRTHIIEQKKVSHFTYEFPFSFSLNFIRSLFQFSRGDTEWFFESNHIAKLAARIVTAH